MIDAEDRELLMTWGLRAVAAVTTVLGSAVLLGTAWRVFDLIKG